jgi:hypothetical protein
MRSIFYTNHSLLKILQILCIPVFFILSIKLLNIQFCHFHDIYLCGLLYRLNWLSWLVWLPQMWENKIILIKKFCIFTFKNSTLEIALLKFLNLILLWQFTFRLKFLLLVSNIQYEIIFWVRVTQSPYYCLAKEFFAKFLYINFRVPCLL